MTEAPESITGEQFIAHAQYSNEGLAWHIDRLLKENARLTKLVATSERLRMEDAFARIREQAAEPRCECPRAFDVTRSELMLRCLGCGRPIPLSEPPPSADAVDPQATNQPEPSTRA
jgi:hypothetical protein